MTPSDAKEIAVRLVNANSATQEKEKGYGYNEQEFKDAVDAMVDEVKAAKKSTKKRRPSYKSRMAGPQTGKYSSDA